MPATALENPLAQQPTQYFWGELETRQQAMSFPRRDWWRTRRHFHRVLRGTTSVLQSIVEEISAAPKKTLFDVATGLPIALLALPSFREWAFRLPRADLVFVGLVAIRTVYGAWRRSAAKRLVRDESGSALRKLLPMIECVRSSIELASSGHAMASTQLQRNVETALSAIAEITRQALQVPQSVLITANLMLPMPVIVDGEPGPVDGCGIVAYDSMPSNPSWTRLRLGDFGAGRVFESGKVQAVEDTTDPVWCNLFTKHRSKCFASFPVRAGTPKVVAVVNIDASQPMVFTRRIADGLFADVLSAPLKLLADLLVSSGAASK